VYLDRGSYYLAGQLIEFRIGFLPFMKQEIGYKLNTSCSAIAVAMVGWIYGSGWL
jgi:hypothetical protein